MDISDKVPLVLHDLYYYDIVACYPTILKTQAYDFSNVDLDNKQERSEFIGKRQRGNENMSSYLISSADALVSYYLMDNKVDTKDIVMTQRDGFILTRPIENNNTFITMELRRVIDFMILSLDRKKYLMCSNGEVIVKGMPHLYSEIEKAYNKFADLDFYNKKRLFGQMSGIKNYVMSNEDVKFFAIPYGEKKYGFLTYKGPIALDDIEYASMKLIDREQYFINYIKPFLDSIYLELY